MKGLKMKTKIAYGYTAAINFFKCPECGNIISDLHHKNFYDKNILSGSYNDDIDATGSDIADGTFNVKCPECKQNIEVTNFEPVTLSKKLILNIIERLENENP